MTATGVLFDVDGTLVDTNYQHVIAWWHAFRSQGHQVPSTTLHRHIGQGAARLVTSVLGHPDDDVVTAHSDFYGPFLHQVTAFPAVGDLLRRVREAGLRVALATSASKKEAAHLQRAIDSDDVDVVTDKDDAEESKPDPDILATALEKAGIAADRALVVGDTVWDVEAARRLGLDCVGVLTGGISADELRDAGAVAVYRDVAHLLAEYDGSPLAHLNRPRGG